MRLGSTSGEGTVNARVSLLKETNGAEYNEPKERQTCETDQGMG
jgi:hypothetical protein